jgi:pimeloyl-ACP methyl ester carboxylesterase
MVASPAPALFIHGLWPHASSWQPWVDRFAAAGAQACAPGWPDEPDTVEQARANPERIAGHGIDDVVDHYAGIIEGLDVAPILIGHSFGGVADACERWLREQGL